MAAEENEHVVDADGAEAALLSRHPSLQDARVLEVGCGDGRITLQYGAGARSVLAIDRDSTQIQSATEHLPPDLVGRVRFQVAGSINHVATPSSFDTILFSHSL